MAVVGDKPEDEKPEEPNRPKGDKPSEKPEAGRPKDKPEEAEPNGKGQEKPKTGDSAASRDTDIIIPKDESVDDKPKSTKDSGSFRMPKLPSGSELTVIEPSMARVFKPAKWRARGGGRSLKIDEYFASGRKISNGLCDIVAKAGVGGMCNVYEVTNVGLFELAGQYLLNGDIKVICEEIGIRREDVQNGKLPNQKQVAMVHQIVEEWKKEGELPDFVLKSLDKRVIQTKKAALKILRPEMYQDEKDKDNIERFQQEGYVMKYELEHSNIVRGYLYFFIDGFHCILEEFIEGAESLDNVLKHNSHLVTNRNAVRIASKVFDAVCESHDKEIVWRDCAPKNWLCRFDESTGEVEEIKATDWGIARPRSKRGIDRLIGTTTKDLSITSTDQMAVTPSYASPEQIRDSKHVNYQTDFFSLGVGFYEMVAKQLPFNGDTNIKLMEVISSTTPESTPTLPNQIIAKKRESMASRMKITQGAVDESKLPKLISEEAEDLITMLMEKDETKRIRRHHIRRILNEIEQKGLYDICEVSDEEAREREARTASLIREIGALETSTEGSKPDERLTEKFRIAGLYEELADIIPRVFGEGLLPDYTREDAFGNAVDYYKRVLDNFKQGTLDIQAAPEDLEDTIHMLECHYRVEQIRVDQLGLERKSSKIPTDIRPKPEFVDDKGKPVQEPSGKLNFFTFGVARKNYEKMLADWTNDVALWQNEVDTTFLAIVEVAKRFAAGGKYIAARKKLQEAKDFSQRYTPSSEETKKIFSCEKYINDEKFYSTLAKSVQAGLNYIKKLIDLKKFPKAVEEAQKLRDDAERLGAHERYRHMKEQRDELEPFTVSAASEYLKFEATAKDANSIRNGYGELESALEQGAFFSKEELAEARNETQQMRETIKDVDREVAGHDNCRILEETLDKLDERNEEIAKMLAASTYEWAAEQSEILHQVIDAKDVFSEEYASSVGEAEQIVGVLVGETGVSNIDANCLEKDKAGRLESLKKTTAKQKEKVDVISQKIVHYKELHEKAETKDENARAEANKELCDFCIKEGRDLSKALECFEQIPENMREQVMISFFDAYKRTENTREFVEKTPDGLEKAIVIIFRDTANRYNPLSSTRNDDEFDRHTSNICRYLGKDPQPIYDTRAKIDKLGKELQSLKDKRAEDEAKEEKRRAPSKKKAGKDVGYSPEKNSEKEEQLKKEGEIRHNLSEAITKFKTDVALLIKDAEYVIGHEGRSQPRDRDDYRMVASYLETTNPGLAAVYYDRFVQLLPKNHLERDDLMKKIEGLKAKSS